MKLLIYLTSFLLSLASCAGDSKSASADSETPPAAAANAAPQPGLPQASNLHEARDLLRQTLRMELPLTHEDRRGDKRVLKSYSFDIEADNGRPMWVIKEKLYDPETQKLFSGANYMMLWSAVDPGSFQLLHTENNSKSGIVIRPRQGNAFVYHPYSQDPDVSVQEVLIGWYEPVQDRTLGRGLEYMKQVAERMGEWQPGF